MEHLFRMTTSTLILRWVKLRKIHRAVILAALYPREISITGLPHPTPAPAISNPVNHFSPE